MKINKQFPHDFNPNSKSPAKSPVLAKTRLDKLPRSQTPSDTQSELTAQTSTSEAISKLQKKLLEFDKNTKKFLKKIKVESNPTINKVEKNFPELQKIELPESKPLSSGLEADFKLEQTIREFKKTGEKLKELQKEENKIRSQPQNVPFELARGFSRPQRTLETFKPLIEQQEMVSRLTEMARGFKGQIEHMENQ